MKHLVELVYFSQSYISVCKLEHLLFHLTLQVLKFSQELEQLKHCSVGDGTASLMTSEELLSKVPLVEAELLSPREERQAPW